MDAPTPAAWRHVPAAARPVAAAAQRAVAAAHDRDAAALDAAVAALAALDRAAVGLLLGTAVRVLLEQAHPDGLDAADVRAVLAGCVRGAAPWQPAVDPQAVLVLLAGALGVLDEDQPPLAADVLARHAALLLAHLAGARTAEEWLGDALREIARTRTDD